MTTSQLALAVAAIVGALAGPALAGLWAVTITYHRRMNHELHQAHELVALGDDDRARQAAAHTN